MYRVGSHYLFIIFSRERRGIQSDAGKGIVGTGQNVLDGFKSRSAGARAAPEAGSSLLYGHWDYHKYIFHQPSRKKEFNLRTSSMSLYLCRQPVNLYYFTACSPLIQTFIDGSVSTVMMDDNQNRQNQLLGVNSDAIVDWDSQLLERY